MTLTDFLLARIAEDEGAAQMLRHEFRSLVRDGHCRALAECEAKRRIVEEHGRPLQWLDGPSWDPAILAIATIYADHPDYREEWKP